MTNQNTQITLADYMRQPDHLARFVDMLGRDGTAYVQSVLIAVSGSEQLMKCTHTSILRSALRAASLGLSCDPALKQAWLVPYNRKVKKDGSETWVSEAQFQPHYKGLYTLAMRTGKYFQINVSPIYEGQRVMENPLTGLHAVQEDNGLLGQPQAYNAAYSVDVTVRRKKDKKVIGWLGYFKTKQGFEKSVYMSCGEIDDHAHQYVKEYDKNPNWNSVEKRPVMEMKTVLRQLLSWADMSGTENSPLVEAMQADEMPETIDAEPEPLGMTYDQAKQVLVKTKKGEKLMGELDADALNLIMTTDKTTDEQKQAATLILSADFNMEPPADTKQSTEKNMKDLGF